VHASRVAKKCGGLVIARGAMRAEIEGRPHHYSAILRASLRSMSEILPF